MPLPAGPERVEQALRSLRGAPVLTGGRGRAAVDLAAAARIASQAGELLIERDLALIELNPVTVHAAGAIALDATVRTAGSSAA
ncbi:MAG: acetate--CoA ligase family protein [bacterium]